MQIFLRTRQNLEISRILASEDFNSASNECNFHLQCCFICSKFGTKKFSRSSIKAFPLKRKSSVRRVVFILDVLKQGVYLHAFNLALCNRLECEKMRTYIDFQFAIRFPWKSGLKTHHFEAQNGRYFSVCRFSGELDRNWKFRVHAHLRLSILHWMSEISTSNFILFAQIFTPKKSQGFPLSDFLLTNKNI